MNLNFSLEIMEKSSIMKFHKHFFSASRALPCGQTDMTKLKVAFRQVAKRTETTVSKKKIQIHAPANLFPKIDS
jgi:hypothetical protein